MEETLEQLDDLRTHYKWSKIFLALELFGAVIAFLIICTGIFLGIILTGYWANVIWIGLIIGVSVFVGSMNQAEHQTYPWQLKKKIRAKEKTLRTLQAEGKI